MRKLARLGRPRSRSASSAADVGEAERHRAACGARDVRGARRARRAACTACQASAAVRRGQRVQGGRSARRSTPASGRSPDSAGERARRAGRRTRRAGRARSMSPRLDVVERQRRAQPAVALHRDAEQQPVQPRRPGVLRERLQLDTAGGARRRAPSARRSRATRSRSRSRSSSSRPNRRRTGRGGEQVEHLGRREPGVGELQQPRDDVEQRVDLPQRPVGQPHRAARWPGWPSPSGRARTRPRSAARTSRRPGT